MPGKTQMGGSIPPSPVDLAVCKEKSKCNAIQQIIAQLYPRAVIHTAQKS